MVQGRKKWTVTLTSFPSDGSENRASKLVRMLDVLEATFMILCTGLEHRLEDHL